ncbi:MAG TPA: class I SAM-dependent methyltransferase [Methanoregulaceae archaeon]|nr:class I SAM-dependent methyltransferase [Methanoregulaceae archaeon]
MRPTAGSWREQWRQLKLAHCAVPNYGNSKEFWNNKKHVQNVFMKGRENNRHQWEARLDTMDVPEHSLVLDIGAGPGTFAIPLALKGCQVTVVEPSPVMREALNERIAKENIAGITVIPKRWEDVKPEELGDEHYDTVIASYSLTMMDIAEAIAKMETFCRGSIHLFWFLTPPTWAKVNMDLWPLLHGGEFPGEPLADWLWQVLIEMGIYANLEVETKSSRTFYPTFDDAMSEYIQRLNCTTPLQETTVKNYLHAMLRQEGDGLVLGDEVLGAHIWWTTKHQGIPGVNQE